LQVLSSPSPDTANESAATGAPLRFQRTQISPQHQITIPSVPFRKAGLVSGDRLHARADGPGRVTLERLETPPGQT
jgi:hypothetical protein